MYAKCSHLFFRVGFTLLSWCLAATPPFTLDAADDICTHTHKQYHHYNLSPSFPLLTRPFPHPTWESKYHRAVFATGGSGGSNPLPKLSDPSTDIHNRFGGLILNPSPCRPSQMQTPALQATFHQVLYTTVACSQSQSQNAKIWPPLHQENLTCM